MTFEDLRDDLYAKLRFSTSSSTEWVKHDPSFKELCERYTEFYDDILTEAFEQRHLDLWALVWCCGIRKMPSYWSSSDLLTKQYVLEDLIRTDRDYRP